ncbi:zinc-ribbon domain-containing protein [Lactobacillus sp. Marseille-P7033]|nr:zinc-ribbon domain-containing protein [Lactobacillus sp. Marseille-P7033]NGC78661.1 zinc-ribbon domain-containing protein [Limosilactobacillus reuteri]
MKFCPNCGNKLQPGDRFCEKCGFQVAKPNEEKQKVQTTEEKKPKQSQPAKAEKKTVGVTKTESTTDTSTVTHKNSQKVNQLKSKLNTAKIQSEIEKDPKKAGIIGGVALVIVIILGFVIHTIQLQPDHALVDEPYYVTMNIKTSTQGFFGNTSTNTDTKSIVIYLDKHSKKAYGADSVSTLKQLVKAKENGTSYSLDDSTLKLSLGEDVGDIKINDIHRSGDEYVGTIASIGSDDTVKVTGTVKFKKA